MVVRTDITNTFPCVDIVTPEFEGNIVGNPLGQWASVKFAHFINSGEGFYVTNTNTMQRDLAVSTPVCKM